MQIIDIELVPSYGSGLWESVDDVRIRRPGAIRSTRHRVFYLDATAESRLEPGGPIVPGPHAYLLERAVEPNEAPRARNLAERDALRIDGLLFRVDSDAEQLHLKVAEVADLVDA